VRFSGKVISAVAIVILGGGIAAAREASDEVRAKVLRHECSVVMKNEREGTVNVVRTVEILDKRAKSEANLSIHTDMICALESFKGSISAPGGKTVKLGKKNLDGIATEYVSDDYTWYYVPSAEPPYTVTYEYSLKLKDAIPYFPSLYPVKEEKVCAENVSYRLKVPSGTDILYESNLAGEPEVSSDGGSDTYVWIFPYFPGYVDEALLPLLRDIVPNIRYVRPTRFFYGGIYGDSSSWESFGRWIYEINQGARDLPEDFVASLREKTAGMTELEKVRTLYGILRERTRYVSIQLGIGGHRSAPASEVHARGYGDCKALSTYMQAMLEAVGIESFYTLINTDRPDMTSGTAGFVANHAMLMVPVGEPVKDTLWLECTAPSLPMGFRHGDCAGHGVLVVTPEGGVVKRVPSYPDSIPLQELSFDVMLKDDGSAGISAVRTARLRESESWTAFPKASGTRRESMLMRSISLQPSGIRVDYTKDNFGDYSGADYIPYFEAGFSFSTGKYADSRNGNRLFVPLSPFSIGFSAQRGKRINPIVYRGDAFDRILVKVHIPEGYTVESVPSPVLLDTDWGYYRSEVTVSGSEIAVVQEIRERPFRKEASEYASFRDFVRFIQKAVDARIVLVRPSSE